jgi:putative ABC transport system ATP-binding protein
MNDLKPEISGSSRTAPATLEVEGVSRTFTMGEVAVPVLHDVDLAVRPGELTVVLGHSGSGKTTLLNIMGGIDRPSTGTVRFEGKEISRLDDRHLTEFRRRHVGFVFQFYNLVPALTARENVQVSTETVDDPLDPAEALELVGLSDRLDHFPAQLSGGEQQRVAIARALAKRPGLLLCDEPVGALDSTTGRRVLELMLRLNDELSVTLVIVTHAAPIADLAHHVIRLDSGRVVERRTDFHRRTVEEIDW